MVASSTVLLAVLVAVAALTPGHAVAFYLPGTNPREYQAKDPIDLSVVKLTSVHTQLPYEYYTLPFCTPPSQKRLAENIGEILGGDRIMASLYHVRMNENVEFQLLDCASKPMEYTAEQVDKFRVHIREEYRAHWLLDNLPAATVISKPGESLKYAMGFPIGHFEKSNGAVALYNHINIFVKVNKDETLGLMRVVGFEVAPQSISADGTEVDATTNKVVKISDRPLYLKTLEAGEKLKVYWTYSVTFIKSDTPWMSRWDTYLQMSDAQIHWYSIANSIAIVVFLSGIVALIMVRTLNRDIARYNDEEYQDAVEETGWKLVHGDIFRPPRRTSLLVACVGGGIQIFETLLVVITLAMMGFLSPAARGSMVSTGLGLFVLLGLPTGYYSARLYKTLKGQYWKSAALLTSVLFPGIIFSTYFFLNFFVYAKHSSGAIPLGTLFRLLAMWFGVSTPCVYLGAYFGFCCLRECLFPYESPVRTNQIPRQVPPAPWYMSWPVSVLLTGILPFGAVFIELFFVFSAMWENKSYYLFGILFVVFLILVVTSALITIVMIYFFLCNEDYHWWWRSFLLSSGMAFYVLLYAIFYYVTQLDITDAVSVMLFFGYAFIIVVTFWFLTGTVGFYAAYWFVTRIYSSVKID
ncbi:EMP/nonaspanin domain family protein [Capsaspora owczarzaki ATCC 30864]|uniref:Transmembrane 9 superfamily member n=1 Tax=Capsaspora owczarzaki (strain ATCC 30864) TaxID=595528 RepID=A0A0D2X4D1_CAPO3|nr:EMP/nonaspanin domain family protein [Capsaspora owczarzaki ATCC 30864]